VTLVGHPGGIAAGAGPHVEHQQLRGGQKRAPVCVDRVRVDGFTDPCIGR
jgi:uncharacterized 2Fe-2S/4Fe-4S cluster protein (DUF4445 family)